MIEFSVEERIEKINAALDAYPFGDKPDNLYDPIRYILNLSGKRVRPLLVQLGYFLFKDDVDECLMPSLSVEIFHNFTLMHDDIMDEAPLRRGKPTVHTKWDQNVAILSGDTMFVKAYETLAKIDPQYLPEALRLFNQCSVEVCEGQQLDMDFETRDNVSVDEYIEMIRLKTAVLLGFSLRLGALIAGANEEDQVLLENFGQKIGIGFQLKDDLLDVFGEQAKVGKQVGGDIIANKKTFLLINALDKAEGIEKTELTKWIQSDDFDPNKKVKAVSAIYENLGIPSYTTEEIKNYFADGFNSLERLNANANKKEVLKSFTEWLINRDK